MNSWISKLLLGAGILMIGLGANAQLYERLVPQGITKEEIQSLKILGYADPAFAKWNNKTFAFKNAISGFQSASLYINCTSIVSADINDFYTNLKLNHAVSTAVTKLHTGKIFKIDAPAFRYLHRSALWAVDSLTQAEKITLFEYLNNEKGRQTLRHYYTLKVLEGASDMAYDTPSILLNVRDYFEETNQQDWLNRALVELDFDMAVALSIAKNLQSLNKYQIEALSTLNIHFGRLLPRLRDLYKKAMKSEDQNSFATLLSNPFFNRHEDSFPVQLAFFQWSAFFDVDLKSDLLEVKLDDRENPRYMDFLNAKQRKKYPISTSVWNVAARLGPAEMIGNEHLQFCPGASKQ